MDERDGYSMGGFGSDVFGEVATARLYFKDKTNDYMRTLLLREYI